jgi:hypothetical protein
MPAAVNIAVSKRFGRPFLKSRPMREPATIARALMIVASIESTPIKNGLIAGRG